MSAPIEDGRLPGLRAALELLRSVRIEAKRWFVQPASDTCSGFDSASQLIEREIARLEALTPKAKTKRKVTK